MSQKPERIEVEREVVEPQPETRKAYTRPAIIHELALETRAGSLLSPPGLPDPFDPFGPEPKQ